MIKNPDDTTFDEETPAPVKTKKKGLNLANLKKDMKKGDQTEKKDETVHPPLEDTIDMKRPKGPELTENQT